MADFKFTRDWEKKLAKEVQSDLDKMGKDVERTLSGLTRQHKGKPVATVKPYVKSACKRAGFDVTEPDLTAYAIAVSEGTKVNVEVDKVKFK